MYDADFSTINLKTGLTKFITFLIPRATGVKKLSNLFVKVLLTTPGTDAFFPHLGGDIMSLSIQKFSRRDHPLIRSLVIDIVRNTVAQILSMQKNIDVPDNEKLDKVNIRKIDISIPDYLQIELELYNRDGDVTDILLPIKHREVA